MIISIGSDHGGFHLKQEIIKYLQSQKIEVVDSGTYGDESVDYPLYAEKVSMDIQNKKSDFGILICTTGIGMCISANKHKGIRAAHLRSLEEAYLSRQHNNSNVICFGAKFIDSELAIQIINAFISTSFEGGRHQRRVDIISKQEEKNEG